MECESCDFRSFELGKCFEHFEETKHNRFRVYQMDNKKHYTIEVS